MNQKIFSLALSAMLFGLYYPTHAQQPKKIPRIGVLRVGSPPDAFIDAFRNGLQQIGYVEGQNIIIDYRWLNGENQFAEAAEALVRLKANVIVATSTPGALAAKRATPIDPDHRSGNGRPAREWAGRKPRPPWGQLDGPFQLGSRLVAQTIGAV